MVDSYLPPSFIAKRICCLHLDIVNKKPQMPEKDAVSSQAIGLLLGAHLIFC